MASPTAGTYLKPRPCYICKQDYTTVDAFYHQLCPACAETGHAKRHARTDLRGRRALLTGGRAKIGMHIALRLLRDGAALTLTTRFPGTRCDASRRCPTRRSGCPASPSSASTCATRRRWWRLPMRSRRTARSTS
ncbi:hypothetical protein GCM10025873_08720 [Demequina sediminis]|nr:hypothetical protein GCM10025873_08720 [Demequina sediminis]